MTNNSGCCLRCKKKPSEHTPPEMLAHYGSDFTLQFIEKFLSKRQSGESV